MGKIWNPGLSRYGNQTRRKIRNSNSWPIHHEDNSDISDKIKKDLFQAIAVPVLYGCTTKTKKKQRKSLMGIYKNAKRCFEQILETPGVCSSTIQVQWTRYAGYCWRSKDKLISDVLLWTLVHWFASVDRPTKIYIHQLSAYTQCSLQDLLAINLINTDDDEINIFVLECVYARTHV